MLDLGFDEVNLNGGHAVVSLPFHLPPTLQTAEARQVECETRAKAAAGDRRPRGIRYGGVGGELPVKWGISRATAPFAPTGPGWRANSTPRPR